MRYTNHFAGFAPAVGMVLSAAIAISAAGARPTTMAAFGSRYFGSSTIFTSRNMTIEN